MSQTRITKEAARDIWQALCQKAVAADQDLYYERVSRFLHSKLEELSEETGQDMSLPLGQFLVGEGENKGSQVDGVQFGELLYVICEGRGSVEHGVEGSLTDLLSRRLRESLEENGRPRKLDGSGLNSGRDDLHGLLKGQVFLVI